MHLLKYVLNIFTNFITQCLSLILLSPNLIGPWQEGSFISLAEIQIDKNNFGVFLIDFSLFAYFCFSLIYILFLKKKYSYRVTRIIITVYFLYFLLCLFYLHVSTIGAFIPSFLLFNNLIIANGVTQVIKFFILVFSFILILAILSYFTAADNNNYIEFSPLMALMLFFSFILISSFNFLSSYLALEGLSMVLYVLTAYPFNQNSIEASIKYFSLGSLSSGLLVYSISLFYGLTGQFNFLKLKFFFFERMRSLNIFDELIFFFTICIFINVFLFKVAAFPCHMWSPDVYEGTWLPATAVFMTIIKFVLYVYFVRVITYVFSDMLSFIWSDLLLWAGIGSLLFGSFSSLYQSALKRLLAHASVSQIGYSLIGLSCNSIIGIANSMLYLMVYIITSLGLFLILLITRSYIRGAPLENLGDLNKIFKIKKNYWISITLTIFLLSMAGVPPMAGFFAKYLVLITSSQACFLILTLFIIILSTINSYIYIKLIKILWADNLKLVLHKPNKQNLDIYFIDHENYYKRGSFSFINYFRYSLFLFIYIFACLTFFFIVFLPELYVYFNCISIDFKSPLFGNALNDFYTLKSFIE